MSNLVFRYAQIEDLERIVEIYNSTIASRMVTADTEPVSITDRKEWFEEHNCDTRPLWVIENSNQKIVAWLSYQSFYGRPAYNATVEISIYVDAEHRGKKIGTLCLEYAIKQAPKYKVDTLLGFIFSHNMPSLFLFKKFGFEEWAKLPDIATLDNVKRSLSILGKKIS